MNEIQSTTDYESLKFRQDNRAHIIQSHVQALVESIKKKNLLHLFPISISGDMEIIDGQHRTLAAKQLQVPIYYIQSDQLEPSDVILANIQKGWSLLDYLNYYTFHEYPEYIKLTHFMKAKSITLKIALNITMGQQKSVYEKFKSGGYKFPLEDFEENIDVCWETIDYIRRMNGYSGYVDSAKFWSALLILVRHGDFDPEKWRNNLHRMVERFCSKANQEDYLKMFMDIYNWRCSHKIKLITSSEKCGF